MNVGEVCSRPPVTCPHDEPIMQVARKMVENEIGAVVVVDPEDRPIGIVTDRDLTLRSLARGLKLDAPVHDVMSHEVASVSETGALVDAARQMGLRRCRRLPVLDGDGRIVGVISTDDLLEQADEEFAGVVRAVGPQRRHHITHART